MRKKSSRPLKIPISSLHPSDCSVVGFVAAFCVSILGFCTSPNIHRVQRVKSSGGQQRRATGSDANIIIIGQPPMSLIKSLLVFVVMAYV